MDERGRVPADFARFVAAHEPRLRSACHALTGNAHVAESLLLDLMATVAVRWRWLRRRSGVAAYLDRLVRRETRAWRAEPGLADGGPARSSGQRSGGISVVTDEVVATDGGTRLAQDAWTRARRMRTHRRLVAVSAAAVLGCCAFVGPHPPATLPDELEPPPVAVPAGVRILPPFPLLADLRLRPTRLPPSLDLNSSAAIELAGAPVPAAIAVVRQELGPLLVVAQDGTTRRVDSAAIAGARLLPTSLSPDGMRAALVTPDALHVLDVTTGEVRSMATGSAQPSMRTLVWLAPRTVLMPGQVGALAVNVDTGAIADVPGLTGLDVTTTRGPPPSRLVELVPTGGLGGLPPRIRLWRAVPAPTPSSSASTGTPSPSAATPTRDVEDRPIFGPAWIGMWRGAGWSTMDVFVRSCSPGAVPLPETVGTANAALGAVAANGLVAGTLVSVDSTTLDIVGFADARTVLVNVSSPPSGSILLAWVPSSGELRRVTAASPFIQISVADLLAG